MNQGGKMRVNNQKLIAAIFAMTGVFSSGISKVQASVKCTCDIYQYPVQYGKTNPYPYTFYVSGEAACYSFDGKTVVNDGGSAIYSNCRISSGSTSGSTTTAK